MYQGRPAVKEVIEQYRRQLEGFGIRATEIILFGSYANGRQRDDSDIDLIILSDDFSRMDLRQRLEVLGKAAARIMQPIEALGYTSDEITQVSQASFLHEAIEEGVKI